MDETGAISYDDVLVPTDGSKAAKRATEQAVELVTESGGTVHALYVMDMGDADFVATPSDIKETRKRLEKKGQGFVDAVKDRADESGVDCVTVVKSGIPEDEIVEYVRDQDIELVVMGRRGRSDPDKPLIGSTTKRVLGVLDVPVRVV
ncbi:universal stress protein [Haladaptatus paucihalophilus DX253]|uniref:Universal stress protein n=1 Tax=Haladaptatus paucihalophilus DX253 TaxID=797209 RepID=E7QZH0_HALPU|nr:universal stress protein [Haladaptatus paucihalophilus]EFW90091.1 universal stress protein [Haladaptatus paucihalophilus DX253]SHL05081.1 Nucleotide-binding universal stress protein, UspA family [Haladaptatus paucihalophilus DX253]